MGTGRGGAGDDNVTAGAAATVLGDAGDGTLRGGDGELYGGPGTDTLSGGAGRNIVVQG